MNTPLVEKIQKKDIIISEWKVDEENVEVTFIEQLFEVYGKQ